MNIDPCAIVIVLLALIVFVAIWSYKKECVKNLCHHAYNEGYAKGERGDYNIPENIGTKYRYTIPDGHYNYSHQAWAANAWELGNRHGRDGHRMLTADEIYKVIV